MSIRRLSVLLLAVGLVALTACSDDDGGGDDATGDGDATTTEAGDGGGEGLMPPERIDGPAAEVSGPLEGGNGIMLVSGTPGPDLAAVGWVEEEFRVSGTATSYAWADGAEEMPADGAFELVEADEADYATRVVVRRPGSPEDFSGTVVVEWLNVSAGFDAMPDYTYMADELVRAGHAWVGVSAQRIGVEGGPVLVEVGPAAAAGAGEGLKALDPERYGDLEHPGDAFAFDIYTQVARALRDAGDVPALGDLVPDRVLATGESQSAFALTTYVNGVQPLTGAFDAFLVHSRGGAAMPLGTPGEGVDLATSVGGNPVRIRTDGAAPVVILQMENDVVGLLGFLPARQDDADRLRLWEVAGTSHADAFQAGVAVDMLGCEGQVNAGPQQFLVRAALRALDTWVRTGEAPPEAPRIEVDESGATPAIVRDDDGIAVGGIRTPVVDVPVDVLSGESAGGSIACELFGSTVPLPDERLSELYTGVDDYMDRFTAATDEAIEAGWVLDNDRQVMLDEAQPDRLAG